jgi:hypothetical protein
MIKLYNTVIEVAFTRRYNVFDWMVVYWLALNFGGKNITIWEFIIGIALFSIVSAQGEILLKRSTGND